MPTGYTAGIIDGTTKDFNEFATQCMRAFGTTIHMRDERTDKAYKPRVPSDYHSKALQAAKEKLNKAETMTDGELVEMRKKEIEESKKYHIESIEKTNKAKKALDDMLLKAKDFNPPTEEHEGIAKFMIEQLEQTIEFDGSTKYHDEALPTIDIELKNIDANYVRFTLMEDAHKDIARHLKEHKEELKRCADSNKWVECFLDALPKTK